MASSCRTLLDVISLLHCFTVFTGCFAVFVCLCVSTKIWTKIRDTGDSDLLQQDLNMLMEWSKQWLLAFNTDKCKVTHIGHELPTVYTMSDWNNTTQLEYITVEKDLGVYMTNNLKPTEQCIQAAKKAMSVLAMVNRQFKIIDE